VSAALRLAAALTGCARSVGGSFVKGINGCYYNVMGLPLHRLAAEVVSLIDSGAL
jgi:predicted house-cleaning NTP pyrophosphatase (Maf/HAM1 superfamily)